jgi:hypothetical protein
MIFAPLFGGFSYSYNMTVKLRNLLFDQQKHFEAMQSSNYQLISASPCIPISQVP